MRNKILVATGFLVLGGLVRASNEPWKSKPYQQWNNADLAAILFNSPWAKKVSVDVSWKRTASSGGPHQTSDRIQSAEIHQRQTLQNGGVPDTSPPDASMSSAPSTGGTSDSLQATFYIRWYSRVIREALAREAVLSGKISDAEAAKLLAQPVPDYEIIVLGPDMTPFQNLTEDQLRSASYLEGKQSKQKLLPTAIRFNKNRDGRTSSLVFFFPKQTGSGADLASTHEKGIQFVCKLKGLDLHDTFDTQKMVDEKGPEF